MNRKRTWRRIILATILLLVVVTGAVNYWVTKSTQLQLYADVNAVPHHKVGLLLGTSRHGRNGLINRYYQYRIDAAVALFQAGKIDYILVSGDNRKKNYNEPESMAADLMARGIPRERIVLDYAGFRTLDSILRCREVFGEDDITIISQPFHNERAVFIANRKGMHVIAFNAQDVPASTGILVQLREKLARVKMVLDLVFNKGPKFYGPKVKIP